MRAIRIDFAIGHYTVRGHTNGPGAIGNCHCPGQHSVAGPPGPIVCTCIVEPLTRSFSEIRVVTAFTL